MRLRDSISGVINPATLSGVLMSVTFFLFLDAILTCESEALPHNRFTFSLAIPVIFSLLGFAVVNVTQPGDFHDVTEEAAKSRAFLFVGWVLLLGSSVLGLVQCANHFVGEGSREYISPGVTIVLATTLLPLSAVSLWWSKGIVATSDDFEW